MNRWRMVAKHTLSLLLLLTAAGCATYPAIGVFQDYNEVLYGQVNANLLVGGSDFVMEGKVTGLKCEGSSNVTYIPPFGQCKGQRGEIFAVCTGGRTIKGEWFGQLVQRVMGAELTAKEICLHSPLACRKRRLRFS